MGLLQSAIYLESIKFSINEYKKLFDHFRNKSILITGATGLIGSTIIDLLLVANNKFELNMKIYALSRDIGLIEKRFKSIFSIETLKPVKYDANESLNIDNHENINYIIHAASNASPNLYNEYPIETMKTNFIGMMNLLDYACQQNECKVLYVSSSEVYGQINGVLPLAEGDYGRVDILNPRSSYASSKRATETLCASYFKERGINTIITRPGHIFGPSAKLSDNRVSSLFVREVLQGGDIVMKSRGSQIRSYTYSLDCSLAILFSLVYGNSGEAYNISNSDSIITIREMAEIIAKVAKKRVIFDLATKKETANFNPMQNASLNSEKLENLGWKGLFSSEQGFSDTINILKEVIEE